MISLRSLYDAYNTCYWADRLPPYAIRRKACPAFMGNATGVSGSFGSIFEKSRMERPSIGHFSTRCATSPTATAVGTERAFRPSWPRSHSAERHGRR